jgi:primosomal replication protein N
MVARKGIDREADLRRQIFLSIIWKISGRTSSTIDEMRRILRFAIEKADGFGEYY